MIHHVYVPRTILACALLALVATVSPVCAATSGDNFTEPAAYGASFPAPAAPEVIAPTSTPASIADLAATGETFRAAAMPAVITPAAATVTTNGLLTFTSQAEFQTAFPGLPKEDFEESPIGAGTFNLCTGPINSSTNQPPNCFVPGDILPGLSIDSDPGHTVPVVGVGYSTLTASSVTLSSTPLPDVISISFSGSNVYAVGMDLVAFVAGGTYTIKVYGSGNVLLDTITSPVVSTAETFFGIYSSQNITKITLDNGSNEVVDNIQFGGTPSNLTFYTSQAAFTTAHPGLPVEDFEESGIADNSGANFTSPLNSTTNQPPMFVPGDILPGLTIQPVTSSGGLDMAVVGGNYLTWANSSKAIAAVGTTNNLAILFPGYSAYAAGMNLMFAAGVAARDATIAVYGPHGVLLGTTTRTLQISETFFGVYSTQPITAIQVLNNFDYEFVDNIRFGGSPAGLTFYDSQASFLAAKPGLPVEDFEESSVAPNTVEICTQPFNSATNEADCFAPGDIIPGITFQPQAPCPGCTMAILGLGWLGAPSKDIGPTMCVNDLEISFAKKNVRYFGTEIWSAFGPADYLLSFYDEHGNFIGSALRNIGTTPIFLGVVSQKHLSKVIVTDSSFGSCEVVDNVSFGAFPWHTIIPAISGH